MAEKQITNSSPGPSSSTLQRGKACLRCRKRKMRCDGAKPACQQCVRAKKADGCEYDDGKGKTRTQLMREHIARLESRIKELETNETSTPSVTLFDPHAPSPYYSESSGSSSHGSPGNISLSASTSPVPYGPDEIRSTMVSPLTVKYPDMDSSWEAQWDQMTNFASGSQVSDAYRASEEPPVELAQMLLELFLPHRHQCGLEVHIGRMRESLGLPPSEQRHPALMNTIYLWACYLSRPESLCEHEPVYLSRALSAMNEAIQYPTKVVDIIQASCLLSMYYLSNGRLFEGNYYASAAASLALQYRLHQIDSDELSAHPGIGLWEPTFSLEPEKDPIERGERILTFWQVYSLDRCWSVALRRPPIIPDNDHPSTRITTPWPQRMEEYESGDLEGSSGNGTIFDFLAHQAQTSSLVGGFSTIALRAKASVLFEAADRLSSSFMRLPASNTMMDEFRVLEHTITRFTATLLPLHQLSAAVPEEKFTLIVVHSLAHAAMIHLHAPFVERDPISREKCARAARAMMLVTKHIAELDFDFLEPIVGPCWLSGAKVLESELIRLQASWPPPNMMEIRGELGGFLFVLTKLSARFPLLGYEAAKVQSSLEGK
ncbi:hypothetical protein SCP_0302210 [Sparassis crispa]|uniref:Zn(2)-C6 fungal-type domain-containing protein n=1 Tax=Sparassis crispa TaxID=139825 RepID=A0A401GEA2_9APHY|nr:hypothetical protein SCP_0302210 [Sparassis crispa]GBE80506.1 hypothetical protein SCP_0302210 [Sparassis crispa]